MTTVLIAGSRYATKEMVDYAYRVVERALARGYTIMVGDNHLGIDRAVVRSCEQLSVPVTVVGIARKPRNGGAEHGEYLQVSGGYYARDRWMVDYADIGIFIWNGHSRGTKTGYEYMLSLGKNAHLIQL